MKLKSFHELIVDEVRTSPKGFTLDEQKMSRLIELLGDGAAKKDLAAAKAVYEMVVVLEQSDGAQAARNKLRLMIDGAELMTMGAAARWRTKL